MRTLLLAFLLLISNLVFSHFYFDLGINGGYGMTRFVNKNIADDGHVFNKFSFAGTYGGKLGLNFNEEYSLCFDVMSSVFRQSYDITDSISWSKSITMKTLDYALLFRKYENGTYFELGPQFSMLKSAGQVNSITGSSDVAGYFRPNFTSLVVGFGGIVMGSENVNLMVGFRAAYSISDIISNEGRNSSKSPYPLNETFYKSSNASYIPTGALSIRFTAELNFDLGYFTRASCSKKRTKFITF